MLGSLYTTFAGRLLDIFFFGAGEAAMVGLVASAATAGGAGGADTGLETPTSAGFGDCFEHALTASNSPRVAKPAIILSLCWRDQDESVVPEIFWLVAWLVDFWFGFWFGDCQVVAILSPPLRLAQSEVIWQRSGQPAAD